MVSVKYQPPTSPKQLSRVHINTHTHAHIQIQGEIGRQRISSTRQPLQHPGQDSGYRGRKGKKSETEFQAF